MSVHRERIVAAALEHVHQGAIVYTADGERLGSVKEIQGEWLKVDAPLRPDYWLNADFVLTGDSQRVEVSFVKPDLGAYRVDNPELETGETGTPAAVDAAMTANEQLEQRIRMERELAGQRRDLPHMHPAGESAPPDTLGTLGEPVEAELIRMESGGAPSYQATAAQQAISENATLANGARMSEQLGYDRRIDAWGREAEQSGSSGRRWMLLLAVALLGCAGAAIAFKAMRARPRSTGGRR